MSEQTRQATLKMIPIASIEVLNPRERNQRIFDDIVGNIKQIGLKKPITVTSRHLRGKQLINARRLIAKRQTLGKSMRKRIKVKSTAEVIWPS